MADLRECFIGQGREASLFHLYDEQKTDAEQQNVAVCGQRIEFGLVSKVSKWRRVRVADRCFRCRQIDEAARRRKDAS